MPPLPSLLSVLFISPISFSLRHDLKQRMDKKLQKPSMSVTSWAHVVCRSLSLYNKPFLSFHLPLSKAFRFLRDWKWQRILLHLSVNRQREKKGKKKKVVLFPPVLDVLLFLLWFKGGLKWHTKKNKKQPQSNTISCAEMIKQLRRIKRIDTFFCCRCLFNATTAREEVLPALSGDCIQLPNKQLNGTQPQ